MKLELSQFEKNEIWNLVPKPQNQSIIGTRWVFRNKLNEEGKVIRNKARIVKFVASITQKIPSIFFSVGAY